ncbi:hypothetical protein [Shewanella algae]|uniref:hypothetical protein n=1 Tax=Shewanella algae TaxID=38313 RepID=UPI0012DD11E1|nr:hypothetical protein [Shewanella algae]QGS59309.1 hypothetical protein GMX02_07065 [Shewanella algae]
MMNKFKINDLWTLLHTQSVFIYHGVAVASGMGNTTASSLTVDQKIINAINNKKNWALCCSTIKVGDSESNFDYWGNVGLIVKPDSPNSILLAHNQDAGSTPDPVNPKNRNVTGCYTQPISISQLNNSIVNRINANEWGVVDFDVAAIYIESPVCPSQVQWVNTTFPDMLILTQHNSDFVSVSLGTAGIVYGSVVTPNDIYK